MYLTQHPGGPRPFSPPPPQASCLAELDPGRLHQDELLRLGQAMGRARSMYPGIVGETLADALAFEEQTKLRFSTSSKVAQLVDHLMAGPPDAA